MTLSFDAKPPIRKLKNTAHIQGRRKTFFDATEEGAYICQFLDQSRNADVCISGKGVINNRISALLMNHIHQLRIPTHYLRTLNMQEQLVRKAEPLIFSVHIHNAVTDDLSDRFGLEKGHDLPRPLIEYSMARALATGNTNTENLKGDAQPPYLSREHILLFGWSHELEMDDIASLSLRVNDILSGFFAAKGLSLSRLTLEFGRVFSGEYLEQSEILLIDEISPETFIVSDGAPHAHEYHGCIQQTGLDIATTSAYYRFLAEKLGISQAVNHPH